MIVNYNRCLMLLQDDSGGAVPQNWSLLAEAHAGSQMLMFPPVDFINGTVILIISQALNHKVEQITAGVVKGNSAATVHLVLL